MMYSNTYFSISGVTVVSRPSKVMPTANGVVPCSENGHRGDEENESIIFEKLSSLPSSVVVTKKYDNTTNEQGKDEEEYIEKAQENTCTVLLKDEKHKVS